MERRRLTLGLLALMLVGIAVQPSRATFDIDVAFADRPSVKDAARAEAAVKIGVGGATLLLRWTQAALR